MEKNFKCPDCGSSDFKVVEGRYVCQICGHEIEVKEEPSKKQKPEKFVNKSAYNLISLTIYAFMALTIIIPLLSGLIHFSRYDEIEIVAWILEFVSGIIMIGFIGTTVAAIMGKVIKLPVKHSMFVAYALCVVIKLIISSIFGFSFATWLTTVLRVLLIVFTAYHFEQWIKNNK